MSLAALELELNRLNQRISRLLAAWLGLWAAAGVLAVVAGSGLQNSAWGGIFVTVALVAIAASFYLQPAYFRAVRRRQAIAQEILQAVDRRSR